LKEARYVRRKPDCFLAVSQTLKNLLTVLAGPEIRRQVASYVLLRVLAGINACLLLENEECGILLRSPVQ
jgi:hypothetical protein